MTNQHKQPQKQRRGTVAVMVALSLTALVGVTAIALDGGTLLNERRHGQITADAAALAGAADLFANHHLYKGKDLMGTAKQAALDVARSNGYTNDTTTNVVIVNIPPITGNFALEDGYVEVILQYNQKRAFSALFASGDLPVRARAVARAVSSNYKKGLILLNPTITDAMQISGDGTVNILDGSIIVNSNAAIAFQSSGNGTINAETIDITGNYQKSGSAAISCDINTGVKPTPDPLAALPEPKVADYPLRATEQTSVGGGDRVLDPGVYRGGINFSSNGKLTLKPGVYIMDGGGFRSSGDGELYGEEIMIYNKVGASGDHGQFLISGNGKTTLTPPKSGTYQGISLFQQRTQIDVVQISGNGNDNIGGVVYAKSAKTYVSGNGLTSIDTLGGSYVCDTMQISGNGNFTVDLGGNVPPAMRDFRLVE